MSQPNVHYSDEVFAGAVSFAQPPAMPSSSITNANIEAGADIETTKLVHRHRAIFMQSGTAADVTMPLFSTRSVNGCTIISVRAWAITACVGDSTVTADVNINGSTILSAVITLDSSVAAYTPEAGTVSDGSGTQDDCYTVVINATIGTGTLATGVCVEVEYDEEYV